MKYKMSFSLITSFSFTILAWFILRRDCQESLEPLEILNKYFKIQAIKNIKLTNLDFPKIHALFPRIVFSLHFFNCNLQKYM